MITLCIDLDGTLIFEDTPSLLAKRLIKKKPWLLLYFPIWYVKGLAFLKQQVARHMNINPKEFTYNQPFLAWVKEEKNKGRNIVLATATDEKVAHAIADYVGIFSLVLASNGKVNLRAEHKEAALNQHFGKGLYDYAGNDTPDLMVWRSVHKAIVVNPSQPDLVARCREIAEIDRIFE